MSLRLVLLFALPGAACAGLSVSLPETVQLESLESRAADGGPVTNRIRFESSATEDRWLMQQSQHGDAGWDNLGIVVDKARHTARFYQWAADGKTEVPFRVSCFLCHANGPRAIRPAPGPGLAERLRVQLWNLKIAAYGPLTAAVARVPGAYANEELSVKTCRQCHDGSPGNRAPLLRQHFLPIRFLLASKQMPPPGTKLPPEDRKAIASFLEGL